MTDRFRAALAHGPLILDAAMGTRLIARGLDLSCDDPALWVLAHPELVSDLHARDVAAGSDAVLTNTFGANRVWLARFGQADQVAAINRRAVALARAAAGPDRFVIGTIGPTAARQPDACREQAELLADAGADALLFETHRADEAEIALRAVVGRVPLALLVSLVTWPDAIAETAQRLADLGAAVLGGNCQDGIEPALRLAERLRPCTDLPLLIKPSAGRPDEGPETPESFAGAVPRLLTLNVRLLGGCCGTTEAHVAALRGACYPGTIDPSSVAKGTAS